METFLFEVAEFPRSRNKIEEDLFVRHRKLKQKIDALKVLRQKEEVKHNKSVPTINPRSKRLASNSERNLNLEEGRSSARTFFQISRFFPRKANISLEELSRSSSNLSMKENTESKSQQNVRFKPAQDDRSVKYPSLKSLNELSESKSNELPEDISKRNKLLDKLRKETIDRGFLNEPEEPPGVVGIHERGKIWIEKKAGKIKEMKERMERKGMEGCTFKPDLRKKGWASENVSMRSMSVETSYASLYERKKLNRSTSKLSKINSVQMISNSSRESSTLNSIRLKDTNETSFGHGYTSLCPVRLNFSRIISPQLSHRFLNN